jgi:hypothetical protein
VHSLRVDLDSEDTWRAPCTNLCTIVTRMAPHRAPDGRGSVGPAVAPILEGVPEESSVMSSRFERALAYMVAAVIVLSLASFVALIIGTSVGLARDDFAVGIWPVVTILPLIGLPIGFVLIVVLLIASAVRRGRAAKDAGN